MDGLIIGVAREDRITLQGRSGILIVEQAALFLTGPILELLLKEHYHVFLFIAEATSRVLVYRLVQIVHSLQGAVLIEAVLQVFAFLEGYPLYRWRRPVDAAPLATIATEGHRLCQMLIMIMLLMM